MGATMAADCCQRVTLAVMHIYRKKYERVNYLDDLGSGEVEEEVNPAFEYLGKILDRIRILESKIQRITSSGNHGLFRNIIEYTYINFRIEFGKIG